jgi:hypothetical protein
MRGPAALAAARGYARGYARGARRRRSRGRGTVSDFTNRNFFPIDSSEREIAA